MTGLPPNTRHVDDPDPAGDMDAVVSSLAVITGATPGGPDPGSGTVTAQQAINTLTGTQSAGKYLRSDGTDATLATIQAGDVPTLNQNTTGTAAGLSATLAVGSGGTGATSQQAAIDALAGAVTNNRVLAGNGTHMTVRALAYADLPGGTGGAWQPADDGFLGGNSDPASASGGGLLIAGTLYLARLIPRVNSTITNLWVCVSTIGAGTSTGTFAGLYSSSGGAALSTSTDCAASFTGTTGWKSIALQAAQSVTAGNIYYAAVLCNLATTQVSLLRQNNSVNNSPQASANAATLRWAQQASFGTTMGSVTLSSNAASAFSNIVLWS